VEPIVVSSRVVVPARALALHASRSGGPGGQNVNKVSTKVELRVAIAEIVGLSCEERRRLETQTANRLDEAGSIVVTSQRTRSQSMNLEDAREKVRELLVRAITVPRRRIATKPSRASKRARLDDKRRQSQKKQNRRTSSD
jgi:ribosome-associated protein